MMKYIFSFLFLLLSTTTAQSQALYIRTFGNSKSTPVIFLHGGPGYNCANFEATTAQKLSENGFFVVVYDRRGEGRSSHDSATFTFQQTFDDLDGIYKNLGIKKAMLIGHSFGGVLATLFAEKYPQLVSSIILVGAPVSLQETFKTILHSSKEIYQANNDSSGLGYITELEKMDTTTLAYGSYCFMHAMKNGFYLPDHPTDEAKEIYAAFKKDSLAKYAGQMTRPAPLGFWKNEHYTTIDLTPNLTKLVNRKMKIYGLYGKEDGLYSEEQVMMLSNLLGKDKLMYLERCSHNVFMDQQDAFIQAIKSRGK